MSNYRVSVRYANSLLQLAIEQKRLDPVIRDMMMISSLYNECRPFRVFLKNPIIHSYKKLEILRTIFKKNVDQLTYLFIELITRKTREDILGDIADQFVIEYRKYKKIEIVDLITSVPVDKSLLESFKKLAVQYVGKGKTIDLKETVNKELIGGFIMKVGDKQIDDSIARQLREVKKKLIIT